MGNLAGPTPNLRKISGAGCANGVVLRYTGNRYRVTSHDADYATVAQQSMSDCDDDIGNIFQLLLIGGG